MYPLRYKLSVGVFLGVTSLLLFYLILLAFSRYQTNYLFIHQVIPYVFVLCSFAIISAPVVLGPNGHWLLFIISVVIISILSLGTERHIYNLQSLVLLGICINIHLFSRREIETLGKKATATEKIKETTNILKSKRIKTEGFNNALSGRLKRYRGLREIGESFSVKLSLEDIYQLAVKTAYKVIPGSDAAVLFIVDEVEQQLQLTASKKSSELPRIKSKNGDIFDHWVFKERQPLNVSDINEDFRFDYKPLHGERNFSSLISVPLISQLRIIGILRLNSKQKNAYTFDDLRLLDFISDLVSSAINNARLYKTTEELSIKDSLTGFYVHRYLKTRLEEETERARITHTPLSVIMIDIDHFKDYNDRYGHSAGDKVLLGISEIIRRNIKDGYIAARYGGEEFVIVLPNTDKEIAKEVAERIREEISSYSFILRRKETGVTISAGVVSYSEGLKDKEELLKAADFCLYRAKREGRNRIYVG